MALQNLKIMALAVAIMAGIVAEGYAQNAGGQEMCEATPVQVGPDTAA